MKDIRDNNVNGIAVTSRKRKDGKVFFSPLTSFSLFEVDSQALKDEATATNSRSLGKSIKEHTSELVRIK